jgi:hypothetical protein
MRHEEASGTCTSQEASTRKEASQKRNKINPSII